MEPYDRIGTNYNGTRHADPRITRAIITALDLPRFSTIVDIGAGTGNYSIELAHAGFHVHAVEPSTLMRQQGQQHPDLQWHPAAAEALPFADASVDGIVCTMAVHHFRDIKQSFSEMVRVSREHGPLVLFVADPRLCPQDCWLADYFQPIFRRSYEVYLPIEELQQLLSDAAGSPVDVQVFLLPHDLTDHFFLSGWRSPERYLEPAFRQGISPLASAPSTVVEPCLQQLAHDLKRGIWHTTYGSLLTQQAYDGGYRFVLTRKQVK